MPKEITHWTLAEAAFRRMGEKSLLKKAIRSHRNLYLWGAVILDSPFYVLWGKDSAKTRAYTERIHDTAGNSFRFLTPLLANPADGSVEAMVSFCAGIATHILSDAAFHPFVYHLSGDTCGSDTETRRLARLRHHTLETYMDIYFENQGLFPITQTLKSMDKKNELPQPAFIKALTRLFGTAEKHPMKEAVFMHKAIQALFCNKTLTKTLHFLNRLPGMRLDLALSSFYPVEKHHPGTLFSIPILWRHPVTGESRIDTVEALGTQALDAIHEAFQIIEENIVNENAAQGFARLKGPNLYTGMEGRRLSEMGYFNEAVDLMPLIKE